MKRTNIYLTLGMAIVVFFLAMITFPSLFTDKSPYEISGVESYETQDGGYAFRTPPFNPGERFIFGSDDSGRDIFSFVIYGARLTLTIGLAVALLRFLLGLFLGIRSALGKPLSTLLVDQFNNVFNAIPPLIICLIILSIGFLRTLPKTYSIIVFVLVMTLVEWARVATFIRERAEEILAKDFIKSERIIGKSDRGIVIENLLPHMFSELIVLFFMEISRVLTLMMQLGIFGIFIGNLKIVLDTGASGITGKMTSYEPEWASMLGSSKNYIRVAPWIVMSCSLMFFLAVLGFNFVGEGLRMLYQEGHKLFKSRRHKLSAFLSLLFIFFISFGATYQPTLASASLESAFTSVPDLALVGMEATNRLGDDIIRRFETLGIEKTDESYVFPYSIPTYHYVTSVDVRVEVEGSWKGVEDVGLLSFGPFSGQGKVVDIRSVDLVGSDYSSEAFKSYFKGAFLLIEASFFDEEGQVFFAERLIEETGALGILVPVDEPSDKKVGVRLLSKPVLTIEASLAELLVGNTLSINIESSSYGGQGKNIVGQIKCPKATDETKGVLIGFDYNYQDPEIGKKQLNAAFEIIESLVANRERLKRNITIVFWDGAYDEALSGLNSYYTEYYYPVKYSLVYMDLRGLFKGQETREQITYNESYITLAKPDTYSMTKFLIEELGRNGQEDFKLKEEYSVFYHKRGIQTLYLGTDRNMESAEGLKDLKKVIVETLVREMY
jgi:peptide/nickel transport system permease protein